VVEPDRRLILRAIKMLSWTDCEYVLFNVVEVPTQTATYTETIGQLMAEVRQKLENLRSWLEGFGYDIGLKVAASRDAVTGILEELQRNGYSLVILQKRRRGRLWQLFTKSTSQRLLRHLTTPILIVPTE